MFSDVCFGFISSLVTLHLITQTVCSSHLAILRTLTLADVRMLAVLRTLALTKTMTAVPKTTRYHFYMDTDATRNLVVAMCVSGMHSAPAMVVVFV